MASPSIHVARAEYDARTAAGERLEFEVGKIVEMADVDSLHAGLKETLVCALIRQLPPPIVAANEQAYEAAPDKVRHPDVALNLQRRPRIAGARFQGAPDLAVEIVSPSESALDLHAKVNLYLEHGARAVWVIWPDERQIDIHQPGQPTRHLSEGGVIENEAPIPAFRLAVRELFNR